MNSSRNPFLLEVIKNREFFDIYAEGFYIDSCKQALSYAIYSPNLNFSDCIREIINLIKIYGKKPNKFLLEGKFSLLEKNILWSVHDRGCRNS
ncbi:MAG: hypothetical protein ABH804_01675 [archaeon]